MEDEILKNRVKILAKRLSQLSDLEFQRFEKMTQKKQLRIAKRLGFDISSFKWHLVTLAPEEMNAFAFVHVRQEAGLIEFLRREKSKPYQHYQYQTRPWF